MEQRGLVERARRGDHDAFTELARGAATPLDQAARLILRDPELARDAVQEALIRAWREPPGLRDPDRFNAWLHRLIVNVCLDQTRRRRHRVHEVELSPIDSPDGKSILALEHASGVVSEVDLATGAVTTGLPADPSTTVAAIRQRLAQ